MENPNINPLNDNLYHKAKDTIFAYIKNSKTIEEVSAVATVCIIEFETLLQLEKLADRYKTIPYIKAYQTYYKNMLIENHYKG